MRDERRELLRAYERAYAEREKTQSAAFVQEYVGNFLQHEAIPGIAYEYSLVQRLLPTITLQDVNKLASGWISERNRVIVAQAPLKPGVPVPTQEQLLAVFRRAADAPVTAYAENLSGDALLDPLPAPGKVTAERTIAGIGVTEWTLSNGARVILKPTDFKADQDYFPDQSDNFFVGNAFPTCGINFTAQEIMGQTKENQ